jgi:DNA-binding transcriptional ArsR family regulator
MPKIFSCGSYASAIDRNVSGSGRTLILLFEKTITPSQRHVIAELAKYKLEEHTFSSLAKAVSEKSGASEPTVKRTLRLLRDLKIIECGDKQSQGKKVRVTDAGFFVLRGYGVIAAHTAPDRGVGMQFPLTPPGTEPNINQKRISESHG